MGIALMRGHGRSTVTFLLCLLFHFPVCSQTFNLCEVCQHAVGRALKANGPDLFAVEHICSGSPSKLCEQFWGEKGLGVLTLLELGVEDDICTHQFIQCQNHRQPNVHPKDSWPPTPIFIQLSATTSTKERVQTMNSAEGVTQDVTSYEASKAENIEAKMKDILERYRRNASRLQAFRESLLSLLQSSVTTTLLSPEERFAFTAPLSSFIQEQLTSKTGDIDDRLDNILAMIKECKEIATMNEVRLKDVRGSLTSMVEVDEWTSTLSPKDRAAFLEVEETSLRAGKATKPVVPNESLDDDDSDAGASHDLEREQEDKGTIPMDIAPDAHPDLFSGDYPPQRPPTAEEKYADENDAAAEDTNSQHSRHHHHHHHAPKATKALNMKLDRVLGAMEYIMLNNQDSSIRVKKIDKVGELVDQLAKMSKEYSDAIGIMRGQFMSMIEVSSMTSSVESPAPPGKPNQHSRHHHHHENHGNSDHSVPKGISEKDLSTLRKRLLEKSGAKGDTEVGITDLIQNSEGGGKESEEGKLVRRLRPGTPVASKVVAVPAPSIVDAPAVPLKRETVRTEGGDASAADNLLMQEHEHRMDRVIEGLQDLIKQMEANFERIRELKRELDIFLEVEVVEIPISPYSNVQESSAKQSISATTTDPLLILKGSAQDIMTDAGLAFDFAKDIEFVVLEIEGIRGKSNKKENNELQLEGAQDGNGFQQGVAAALKKLPTVGSVSTVSKALDVERSNIPMGSSDDAATAANNCARLTRQAKRVTRFIRLYSPKK